MRTRHTISRLALVAMGALAGLVAGEVAARLLGPSFQVVFRDSIAPSDDPVLGYELRPGARDGKHRINAAGMRDHEVSPRKPPDAWRLAVIGDSIAYGSGVSQDGAFAKQLEALYAESQGDARPRIEVLNFGVPGYNVSQVVERLRTRALPFEPDAVLYAYALNDPQAFSIEAEALRRLRDDLEPTTTSTASRWLAHSHLYLLARRVVLERRSQAALRASMPNDPAYEAARSGDRARYFRTIHTEGESAARLARGLDDLAALARDRHLPVIVVLFPLFQRDGASGPEALADVHARLAAEAERRDLRVLDLLPVYQAATRALGSDLAVDFMHPDAIGHRVAAFAILRWLCAHEGPAATAPACTRPPATPVDAAIARVVDQALAASR